MNDRGGTRRRKRRTPEHVLADMSVNYVERLVLRRGHQLMRMPLPEYGTDAIMFHFSDTGEFENGQVQFQLKATSHLRFVEQGRGIAVRVDSANLQHWYWEVFHPVILVLYDGAKDRAFWLDVQQYVDDQRAPSNPETERITLRIPFQNKLTVRSISRFREMSLSRMRIFA